MNMSASNIIAEAAELGLEVRRPEGLPAHYVTVCRKCQEETGHSYPLTFQPHVMATKLRNRGWSISRKEKPMCPKCMARERSERVGMKVADHITWSTNPKIARKVYGLLDDHFNEETKLYRSGWNDAKIAKEIDISVEVVLRIREEAYGRLAEDPAMQSLRDDFEMLKMELADYQLKVSKDIAVMFEKIADAEKRIPTRSVS